jgi:hypothetical protein
MKRVIVLAEPESLFLPHCLARLAQLHPLAAVIEVPPQPLAPSLRRSLDAFGPRTTASLAAAEALARVVDRVSPDRYYSLRKLARRLGIPYERVSGLHAPDCLEAVRRQRPDVVFAQVSRRIEPGLLALAPFWNKHCSLLPGHAGVFPVFWTLLDADAEIGVTVHVMDEEFDRGPILQQARVARDGRSFFGAYRELYDAVPALVDRALRGDVLAERPAVRPSYFGFPTRADRAAFRRAGRRFGSPFRLHARVMAAG